MIASRRLARHSTSRLSAAAASTRTTLTAGCHQTSAARIYLTKAKPRRGAPQHARSYRSTIKYPYFASEAPPLVADLPGPASLMRRAFRWYSKKLSTHPLLTKSLTGAIIAATGDILCQAGTYTPPATTATAASEDETPSSKPQQQTKSTLQLFLEEGWDYRRSLHFFVLGLTFVAPTSHYWYGGLAKHPWTRGQSFMNISKRVALDQFVWTPVFFVIWLGGFWSMEERQVDPNRLQQQMVDHLPDIMIANWIVWIPAQYLNFKVMPVKFQVLFVNVIELAWNAYLSFATQGGGHGHSAKVEDENEVDVANKMAAAKDEYEQATEVASWKESDDRLAAA